MARSTATVVGIEVLQLAERYFRIAAVVREYPRAFFNRLAYVAEHRDFKAVVEPRLADSPLPQGITATSASGLNLVEAVSPRRIKTLHDLCELKAGDLAVLLGDGGVGKSTALALLRAEVLRTMPDSTLPVLISLANYVPGALDRLIHQELGVDHGAWHSLPDRILLLCDGLNECPSANVSAFLEELKPLLKRSQVTCVLSTRESTRHSNVVLPQAPVACVKVEIITPVAIHRIAEHELHEGTAKAFVTAYISLANRANSPHLWTPFAVLVALRLWRLRAALPLTLGEMLEVLLKSRCARDAEFSEQYSSPDVVLRLAGALAFQCIVIDRRLECPALEAGKWIREAKKYCSDALGIADMTENEVVALLMRHEILHLATSGHLSFGHQLLAGALAAPALAQVWQGCQNCLGEPVADDVWIFAARMIPQEHLRQFLEATFNTDLMLGARAARELPSQFHELAERLLIHSLSPESPEIVRIQGLFALARLGTPGAVAKLREASTNADSPTRFAAQRALAAAGDLDYLRQLLPEVDQQKSGPFKVSGGVISVWEAAPVSTRLDLARHRLSQCRPGDPVSESLSLLAYERNSNDAELIERHLQAASDLSAWQSAFYALHKTAPVRAKELLKEMLLEITSPGQKAIIIRIAALIGVDIDIHAAFECALADIASEPADNHASFEIERLISDVVTKSTLPSDLIAFVERELPCSSGDRRDRLWQIASCCESSVIAEYAVSCIDRWGADLGQACNYFIEQPELTRVRRQQLIDFCERGFENEETWYDWKTWRALALIGDLGFTAKAAGRLSAMVQRLTRVQRATTEDDIASLSPSDAEVLDSTRPEYVRSHLGRLAAHLIPAVAHARAFLPRDVLLSLLYFDTHSFDVAEHQRKMLSGLSDDAIDDVLSKIEEPWTRLSGLVVVCARGSTEIRVGLLANEIRRSYTHLAALSLLSQAIEACWCKAICQMVVKAVAEISVWTEYDSQFFWDFARMVSKYVGPDDQAAIEEALSEATTVFAKRILSLWRDYAIGTRIGMARLSLGTGSA